MEKRRLRDPIWKKLLPETLTPKEKWVLDFLVFFTKVALNTG